MHLLLHKLLQAFSHPLYSEDILGASEEKIVDFGMRKETVKSILYNQYGIIPDESSMYDIEYFLEFVLDNDSVSTMTEIKEISSLPNINMVCFTFDDKDR